MRARYKITICCALVFSVLLFLHLMPLEHPMSSKEILLKDDLFTMRRGIDEFTYDKKREPQSLDELVQAGYLKRIPIDPVTNKPDWDAVMEVDPISEGVGIGIADVHSSSRQISTEGTAYDSW
jgi:general secretion pathway protein G